MLALSNKSPFSVNFCPMSTLEGIDALSIFFSASLELDQGQWQVCDEQLPAPMGDDYYDDEQLSSVRYPSQLSIAKPATDLIINGAAVSAQQAAKALEVSVEILDRRLSLHVFGDRVWHRGQISEPEPFERMPIIWENAYGGSEELDGTVHAYDHNPLGKGWKRDAKHEDQYQGLNLPNLEWPNERIQAIAQRPRPAGFGAVPVASPSRAALAGSYDEPWQKQHAPFLPPDFNPAFFNSAIPELQFAQGLMGGEHIRLRNLNAHNDLAFNLPVLRPAGEVVYGKGAHGLNFNLETVIVETEALIVRMFWQAFAPIPRTLADIKEINTYIGR